MAHMHVSITFILVFGIICSVAGLLKDTRKGGMGSNHWYRNPFYQRYLRKVLNPYAMSRSSLKANYPTVNYGVGSYNQLYLLGSMSERTHNPMELNLGGNYNFIPSTMSQVSRRENYQRSNDGVGSYSQRNPLRSMSEKTQRPMGWQFGGNYYNPIPTTLNQVSQRANYPTAYYGVGSYSQLKPLASTSERTQRPMGWNFGGNYNNPIRSTMSQNYPRANYPTAYYGVGSYSQRNELGSIPGWPFGGISNNPINSSTQSDSSEPNYSTGDNEERNSTQSKPFDTISRFIPRIVVWPFGGIYKSYGEHIFQFPVRYYGYTLGSPLVLTYRVLYPKRPVVSYIPRNIYHSRDPDRFVAPCPIHSSADTESHGVRSTLINGRRSLSFPVGQPVSPVPHDITPVIANHGLGLRSRQETYDARYSDASDPGTHSYTAIRPIVLWLGNINSGYNNNFPAATSITRNIQNVPNDFGQSSLKSGLDCYGHGNYPTEGSSNIMPRGISRPIGYIILSPSYGTQDAVSQSVNRGSYAMQDPFVYQQSAPRSRFERYGVVNPTKYPASTLSQYTQSPDSLERFGSDGPIRRYGVQLPLTIIYPYPNPEAYKALGYDFQ